MQHVDTWEAPENMYQNIRLILRNHFIAVSDPKPIDYGLQFTVSIAGWSGVMRL
jgi:hypothetical protein